MTEAEWLGHPESWQMVRALYGRLPGRERSTDERFRRFAVACTQRAADALPGGHSPALDLLEASINAGTVDLASARRSHRGQMRDVAAPRGDEARRSAAVAVSKCLTAKTTTAAMACREALAAVIAARGNQDGWVPGPWPYSPEHLAAYEAENEAQVCLVRCIFGNPFHPVSFDPFWRTSTVTTLAQTMYDSRDFSAMPILADALMDAGCDSADILDHCRGPGAHTCGCWVVTGCLGKS